MKINVDDIQLSGKGAIVSQELVQDNIKLVTDQTELHELVVPDGEETRRIGWLVPNSFEILADFTAHTEHGMRGKSTHDIVERALILDGDGLLAELVAELVDVDTSESEALLDNMLHDGLNGQISLDDTDPSEGLIIISPRNEFVFVQSDDSSIRIHADDGVFVLNRGEDRDKLIVIDKKDGINVVGDKNVSIGPDGLMIDGKPFIIEDIIADITSSIGTSMATLGQTLGSIGASFGKNFGKSFGKNFGKKFDDDEFDINFDF